MLIPQKRKMASVRQLRRQVQSGGCDDEVIEQAQSPSPVAGPSSDSLSPARRAQEVIPPVLHEDRLYYWDRMSQLIRLQRWWKAIHARRVIHTKAVERRRELAELFESESAVTIQAAWRRFHQQKVNEETESQRLRGLS